MSFFDEDPFESMIERMFRSKGNFVEYSSNDKNGRKVYRKSDSSSKNFIEAKKFFYFIRDLSNKKNIEIKIKDSMMKNNFNEKIAENKILEIKTDNNEIFEFIIPKNIAKKKFEWKFNNGILEVKFIK